MKLNTYILFFSLVKILQPDLVCDIGALDASTSLFSRKLLPHARIIAFEPNPNNFALMEKNRNIRKNMIEIEQKAVCNKNNYLTFYLEGILDENDILHRGMSSTKKRTYKKNLGNEEITVVGTRLDSYVLKLKRYPEKIALWIDVEGGSYEVIEGFREIRDAIKLVCLEVETKELFLGERLESSVIELMEKMGFVLVGQGFGDEQHNLVFVDGIMFSQKYWMVKTCILFSCFFGNFLRLFKNFGGVVFRKIGNS